MRRAAQVLLVMGALAAPGCKGQPMATSAQCEELFDRFVDLKLSEDPSIARITTDDRARLRAKIAKEVMSDSDVQQVKTQCLTEVTAAEYACAIKAATSREWNDCIQ
jgi:hypothetical protein